MSDEAATNLMWEAPDRNWRELAACRGCDPELFHPRRGEDVTVALAICATCPVVDTCLEYAMQNNEMIGVWGGTTERQRRGLRRNRRIADGLTPDMPRSTRKPIEHGTTAGYQAHRYRKDPACPACLAAHSNSTRLRKYKAQQRRETAA